MSKEVMELLDIVLRSMLSLVSLFLVTKLLGKKQVSQLSLFDYVIGISIGNFAAEATINLDSGYLHGIVAVFMFGLVAYLVNCLTMKSIKLRRFFMGTPTVLIEDGKILRTGLKKVKFDINDLLEVTRDAGYFDLNEISYALMEANGKVSFLPKSKYKSVTATDMKIETEKEGLYANVVIDSKIMHKNLHNLGKDENWLLNELKKEGYDTLDDVILVTMNRNNKLNIYKGNKDYKAKDILE